MFNINNDFLLYDFEPKKLGFRLRDFLRKKFWAFCRTELLCCYKRR